jgi:beta-galactosidase
MKKITLSLIVLALLSALAISAPAQTAVPASPVPGRLVFPLDSNWRFIHDDVAGANATTFDDSAWRPVSLPHDWSIEGPFDPDSPVGGAGGFLPAGIGWYRKMFTLPSEDSSRRVYIQFDGIMSNSNVYINGFLIGARPYGYVEQYYDLTGHLNFNGTPNVLAVRVDNSIQPLSRYYTGSGIYRHVRLIVTNPVHIEHWGVFVSTPQVTPALATVHIQTTVTNSSNTTQSIGIETSLYDSDGKLAASGTSPAQSIAAGQVAQFEQDLPVSNPQLWNLDSPNLYHSLVRVLTSDGGTLDNTVVIFGIRSAVFKPDTGFWLNGQNIKLKGVCLHQDGGAFGEAVPKAVWARRLTILKSLGVNAIRWAHNPVSPEILDLCDELGLVCMDEMFDTWTVSKTGGNHTDYSMFFSQWSLIDLRDTVLRDRNHPSIIFYSAGNEIHDTPMPNIAIPILTGLVAEFHKYDPTRPVTQALFRPNASHDYDNGLADLLDVIGTNYRNAELIAAQTAKPTRKIVNTEDNMGYPEWRLTRDTPALSGQFLWAGIDYLGEAATTAYPVNTSNSGLVDRAGQPKALGYERQSWWSDTPVVHLVRLSSAPGRRGGAATSVGVTDWNPTGNATTQKVVAYTNADEVELFLNGQSLGVQKAASLAPQISTGPTAAEVQQSLAMNEQQSYQAPSGNYTAPSWTFPFQPGVLKVVAKKNGQVVATDELRTAGPAAKIILETNHPKVSSDFDDVSFVTATVVDANGVRVPSADNLITFKTDGPGTIVAVDNANRASIESYQGDQRKAYNGRAYAALRATAASGNITLTASADGLAPGALTIEAVPTLPGTTAVR